MKNNVYSLREGSRLEKIRNKARADKKERAKSKAKAKASTTYIFTLVVNTFNRVVNSFHQFLNIFFGLMLNTFNT